MRHNAAYYYDLDTVDKGEGGKQTVDEHVKQTNHGRGSFWFLHRIYTM